MYLMKIHIDRAMDIYQESYRRVMQFQDRCRERKISTDKSWSFREWELFASHLFDIYGNEKTRGLDLINTEVKSAVIGADFCYYYYSSWSEKLRNEAHALHCFISHSNNFLDFCVRVLLPSYMNQVIEEEWYPFVEKTFIKQMMSRCNMGYQEVVDNGIVILNVHNGKVIEAMNDLDILLPIKKAIVPEEEYLF